MFLVAVSTVFLIMALGKFTETTGETYTTSTGWTFSARPTLGLGMLLHVQLLAHGQNFLIGRHTFLLVTG